jgi:hypothetical protein
MTYNIKYTPIKGEEQDWFISFLKEKENQLISECGFKRVKTQKKLFYCEQGRFNYAFVYVKCSDGSIFSPLREYLGIGKNKKMSSDFKQKLIMKASRTTYQKAVEDIHDSFTFWIGKKTLNRYVISDANQLEICEKPQEGQNVLIADSTKVRNGKGGHHEVMGAISLNYDENSSSLVGFGVNKPPKNIAQRIDLKKFKVFVGDADLGLRNFFKGKLPFHLCHHHVISDVSFFMWQEGLNKVMRKHYKQELERILYTLQNSTKKYWSDNKTGRLVNRIIKTKMELRTLAAKLSTAEQFEAARYISDHVEHMITAANFALVGVKVPWTTNHAERLMQEIGIRTKKKGMNWTEQGLEAVLKLVLKRYFLPKKQRTYKHIFANKQKKVVET